MISFIETKKSTIIYKSLCSVIAFAFLFSCLNVAPVKAQELLNLPVPGTMVGLSEAFTPVLLKGMTLYPDEPLKFDFIIDSGNGEFDQEQVQKESERLVKYFLASMTVPKDDLWVNLSPYEKDRIIPNKLGKTELGRDLLAQDYILKQLTATMLYPENELGKKFWDKVRKLAKDKYDITDIPLDTFNKVWIMPESASVYEHENTVYVTDSHLKVMLDSDYQAALYENQDKGIGSRVDNLGDELNSEYKTIEYSTKAEIIREVILPEIEREVNQGKNFAPLRQIYHSLILAKWYKETIKNSLLSQVYTDQNKTAGLEIEDQTMKTRIYDRYMQAYKKGVFDYIKEDYDSLSQTVIPRKYFSGGFRSDLEYAVQKTTQKAMLGKISGSKRGMTVQVLPEGSNIVPFNQERRKFLKRASAAVVLGPKLLESKEVSENEDDNESLVKTRKEFRDYSAFVQDLYDMRQKNVNQHIAAGADINIVRPYQNAGRGHTFLTEIIRPQRKPFTYLYAGRLYVTNKYPEDDNPELVQFLIDNGADVNLKTKHGSPLDLAIKYNLPEIAKILILNGAKSELENSFGSADSFSTKDAIEDEHQTLLKQLLKKGADESFQDKNGISLLMSTVEKMWEEKVNRHPEIESRRYISPAEKSMSILLEHDADVNAQDIEGRTALMIAILKKNKRAIELLLKHGNYDFKLEDNNRKTAFELVPSLGLKDAEIRDLMYTADIESFKAAQWMFGIKVGVGVGAIALAKLWYSKSQERAAVRSMLRPEFRNKPWKEIRRRRPKYRNNTNVDSSQLSIQSDGAMSIAKDNLETARNELISKAQELLDFLGKRDIDGEAGPIAEGDDKTNTPVILALGSPSPEAFKNAALDWKKYTKEWGFKNVPIIASTGRGRGYAFFVIKTLEFLEKEDKKNSTEYRKEFLDRYGSEINEAEAESINDLQKNYRDNYFESKDSKSTPGGWIKAAGELRKYPLFKRVKSTPADVLTEAKVISFLFEKYGGMSEEEAKKLISLEEISDNTYENINESYEILDEIQQANPDKPLKIRIIAAGFHRMRSFLIAVGSMKEGQKRNSKLKILKPKSDYDTRAKDEVLWEINAEDSERLSLKEMFETYGEDSFYDYSAQMIGEPNGGDEGEIGRFVSFGGQWLVHSKIVTNATVYEWGKKNADHLRNFLLGDYQKAKKLLDELKQADGAMNSDASAMISEKIIDIVLPKEKIISAIIQSLKEYAEMGVQANSLSLEVIEYIGVNANELNNSVIEPFLKDLFNKAKDLYYEYFRDKNWIATGIVFNFLYRLNRDMGFDDNSKILSINKTERGRWKTIYIEEDEESLEALNYFIAGVIGKIKERYNRAIELRSFAEEISNIKHTNRLFYKNGEEFDVYGESYADSKYAIRSSSNWLHDWLTEKKKKAYSDATDISIELLDRDYITVVPLEHSSKIRKYAPGNSEITLYFKFELVNHQDKIQQLKRKMNYAKKLYSDMKVSVRITNYQGNKPLEYLKMISESRVFDFNREVNNPGIKEFISGEITIKEAIEKFRTAQKWGSWGDKQCSKLLITLALGYIANLSPLQLQYVYNMISNERFYENIYLKLDEPADSAQLNKVNGGIDMNELEVDRQGSGVDIKFNMDAAMQPLLNMDIQGFSPRFINFYEIPSILPLLGLEPRREDEEFEVSSLN